MLGRGLSHEAYWRTEKMADVPRLSLRSEEQDDRSDILFYLVKVVTIVVPARVPAQDLHDRWTEA